MAQIPRMQEVTSSNVHSVGRDDDGHLYVRFRGAGGVPGSVYRYDGVADAHHDALLSSNSPGKYFHGHVKSLRGTKIDEA